MKIIKSIVDPNTIYDSIDPNDTAPLLIFKLGLGDDGFIYYQCLNYPDPNQWHPLNHFSHPISIETILLLANEFGPLISLL